MVGHCVQVDTDIIDIKLKLGHQLGHRVQVDTDIIDIKLKLGH